MQQEVHKVLITRITSVGISIGVKSMDRMKQVQKVPRYLSSNDGNKGKSAIKCAYSCSMGGLYMMKI